MPLLLPVFASPCDPGAVPGSHLLFESLYIKTSLRAGAFVYATSPTALKLEVSNLVSTLASV